MLFRLMIAFLILNLIATGGWYFWSDIQPWLIKYKDVFGSVGSVVGIILPVITLLIWVFKPRQQPTDKGVQPASLIKANKDVVIGSKQENHYH